MKSLEEKLIAAVKDGKAEEVNSLLEAKANINSRHGQYEETPLICAVRLRRVPIIKLLCNKNPDQKLEDKTKMTALAHYKHQQKHHPTFSLAGILEGADNLSLEEIEKNFKYLYARLAAAEERAEQAESRAIVAEEILYESGIAEPVQIRGFRELVESNLSQAYGIAKAIQDGTVIESGGSIEKLCAAITTIAPVVEEKFRGAGLAMNAAAIFIKFFNERQQKLRAENVVKAFEAEGKEVTTKKLKSISRLLAERYRQQIIQLRISTVEEKGQEPDPRAIDSVAILAKAIVKRIIFSIAREKNLYKEYHSAIAVFVGREEKIPAELTERCILATLEPEDSREDEKQTLGEVHHKTWTVAGVLDRSGLKIKEGEEIKFYKRNTILGAETDYEKYGFYLGRQIELTKFTFTLIPVQIEEKKQDSNFSRLSQSSASRSLRRGIHDSRPHASGFFSDAAGSSIQQQSPAALGERDPLIGDQARSSPRPVCCCQIS